MGLAWGSPHKVLSSGELPTQSPRKVFPVGIVWGGFAWVSETGVFRERLISMGIRDWEIEVPGAKIYRGLVDISFSDSFSPVHG